MKSNRIAIILLAAALCVAAWFAIARALKSSAEDSARGGAARYSRFFRAVPEFIARAGASLDAYTADETLALSNELLRASAQECEALRRENAMLRAQLGFASATHGMLPAEVVSSGRSAVWNNIIRIGKGAKDGVGEGDAVLATARDSSGRLIIALVGRIVDCASSTADVLLCTDPNNRASCVVRGAGVGGAGAVGVVSGGGIASASALDSVWTSRRFAVEFLDKDLTLSPGSRVETSGLGGLYPAGIPVGEVTDVEADSSGLFCRARVAPYVDFPALERVFVATDSGERSRTARTRLSEREAQSSDSGAKARSRHAAKEASK